MLLTVSSWFDVVTLNRMLISSCNRVRVSGCSQISEDTPNGSFGKLISKRSTDTSLVWTESRVLGFQLSCDWQLPLRSSLGWYGVGVSTCRCDNATSSSGVRYASVREHLGTLPFANADCACLLCVDTPSSHVSENRLRLVIRASATPETRASLRVRITVYVDIQSMTVLVRWSGDIFLRCVPLGTFLPPPRSRASPQDGPCSVGEDRASTLLTTQKGGGGRTRPDTIYYFFANTFGPN